MVNAIPEIATLESYVRGKTYPAILAANKQINQALVGAALSVGTNIEIIDMPGYAPNQNSADMIKLAGDALGAAYPDEPFSVSAEYSSGSTDMGDLSCIMPVVHPYCAGAAGKGHGNDYRIVDPVAACVDNAKWQLVMLTLLLRNGAERAKQVIDAFEPRFASKEEFLAFQDSLNCSGNRIVYREDGVAEVNIQ